MKLLVTTDRFALEYALALRRNGDEVLALAVGDAGAERSLRHALAMGVDRAVRVADAEATSAVATDPLALASVLAAVARAELPDLILCRAQSPELEDDVSGIALAGLLGLPHAYDVVALELHGKRLSVRRRIDGAREELLRLAMPALVAVRTASNAPRQPNLRAVKHAREQRLAVLALGELGLNATALRTSAGARVAARHERPPREPRPIEGSAAEIAARIVELAREWTAS